MNNAAPQPAHPLWTPSETRKQQARITDYMRWLARERGLQFDDYQALWTWSVTDLDAFWRSIVDYFGVRMEGPVGTVLESERMPGANWFPGAALNYVDQVFRHATTTRPAILFDDEEGAEQEISWHELERRVAAFADALRSFGVQPGDRVVACLPNRPEAAVAFLACASVGAVWSICSPDMGEVSVLDRFRQIQPKVLIAATGYRYGGKVYDRSATVAEIRRQLPTVERLVLVGEAGWPGLEDALHWEDLMTRQAALKPIALPFDHPLWIVYSSGTTGIPKAIVHGHGGVLLAQLVALAFHNDLGPNDRFHWYSSSGWIMWNCQVGALLVGSTICIYDGNPGYPDANALWRFAGRTECTFFGAGAAFFASCLKAGVEPAQAADLGALRAIGSTGSPLSPECYEWLQAHAGNGDVWLAPMSGGTDIAAPFVGALPTLPVYSGEMQCRALGAAVYAYDENGRAVTDEVGELVCTRPMPNMPLYLWNDEGGQRYLESYYDTYPGVWRHGDWIRITPRGGAIIYGRSDATINRHGVRMGTSELYRAVEAIPEVLDSLVVDLEYLGRPSWMPLFVVLAPGRALTPELEEEIRARIRTALSPRHVPNDVFAIPEVPRTLSGKKLELPVKKLLLGQPLDKVVNRDAMANPGSLDWFVALAETRRTV